MMVNDDSWLGSNSIDMENMQHWTATNIASLPLISLSHDRCEKLPVEKWRPCFCWPISWISFTPVICCVRKSCETTSPSGCTTGGFSSGSPFCAVVQRVGTPANCVASEARNQKKHEKTNLWADGRLGFGMMTVTILVSSTASSSRKPSAPWPALKRNLNWVPTGAPTVIFSATLGILADFCSMPSGLVGRVNDALV